MNTEAAIKLVPLTLNKESEGGPTDKDGFDGYVSEVMSFNVEVALNGFFVSITYADPELPDERYVLQTMDEVVDLLRAKF